MTSSSIGAVLLVTFSLLLASCEQTSRDSRPPVDIGSVTGDWVEVRDPNDPGFPPRSRGPATTLTSHRVLHLDETGTWWMGLGSAAGKPTDETRMAGTWKADGPRLLFSVTTNALGEDQAGLAPMDTVGVVNVTTRGGQTVPRLRVSHVNGEYVPYKPAK